MSLDALNHVWKTSPVKGADLLVMLALADWADENGWCYPTIKAVAAKARLTAEATRNVIARLHHEGHLTIYDHFVNKSQTQNYYLLTLPGGNDAKRPMTPGRLVMRARTPPSATEGGTAVSITPPPSGTEGGTPSGTEAPPLSGTQSDTSIEPSIEPSDSAAATHARAREDVSDSEEASGQGNQTAPPPAPFAAVFAAWHNAGALLTGQIADELKDSVGEFGEAFVIAAIEEMGKSGARNLKYLRRILDDCRRDGRTPGQPRPSTRPPAAQQAAKRAATEDPDNWAGKASGLGRPAPMRSAVPPGWKPGQKEKSS